MQSQSAVELNKSTVMPFFFESNEVRIVEDELGNQWWVAKDVCDILDINNVTMAMERIPEKHLTSIQLRSGGQIREMNAIDESGLYRLILRSDKPQVEPFMEWVTSEVLPSIRKTGNYNILQSKYISVCNKNEKLIETYNLLAADCNKLIKDNEGLGLYGDDMNEVNEEFRTECDKLVKSLKKCHNVIERQTQSNRKMAAYAKEFAGFKNPSHCQARIFLGTKDGMFEIKNFELLKTFAKPSYYTTIGAIDWIHKMFKTESPGFYNEIYSQLDDMSCKSKNTDYMYVRHSNVVLFHPHIVKKFLNNLIKNLDLFSKFRVKFS